MSTFAGTPQFLRNALWVAMETMHFHIANTKHFFRTTLFRIQEVPINNLAPMRNRPGGARYVKSDAGVSVTSL